MNNKKCLVTGGSGFVGTHLSKRLLSMGHDVRIMDISEPEKSISDQVEFLKTDIRDKDQVKKGCKEIDYVFHAVALVPISKADKLFNEVNAGGTKNILEAAKESNVESVVHLSSTSVYKIPKRGDLMTDRKSVV